MKIINCERYSVTKKLCTPLIINTLLSDYSVTYLVLGKKNEKSSFAFRNFIFVLSGFCCQFKTMTKSNLTRKGFIQLTVNNLLSWKCKTVTQGRKIEAEWKQRSWKNLLLAYFLCFLSCLSYIAQVHVNSDCMHYHRLTPPASISMPTE